MEIKKDSFTRENFRTESFMNIAIKENTQYVKRIDNFIQFYYVIYFDKVFIEVTSITSALTIANLLLDILYLKHKNKELKSEINHLLKEIKKVG